MTKLVELIQKVVGDKTLDIFETKHNPPGIFNGTEWGTNTTFKLQGINHEKNTRTVVEVTIIPELLKLNIHVIRFSLDHVVLLERENIIIYLSD